MFLICTCHNGLELFKGKLKIGLRKLSIVTIHCLAKRNLEMWNTTKEMKTEKLAQKSFTSFLSILNWTGSSLACLRCCRRVIVILCRTCERYFWAESACIDAIAQRKRKFGDFQTTPIDCKIWQRWKKFTKNFSIVLDILLAIYSFETLKLFG